MKKHLFILFCLLLAGWGTQAQEFVAPITHNPFVRQTGKKPLAKTTILSLPFFEDFTGASPVPDNGKWVDRSVYINNTMAVSPISRGVATFDALSYQGAPYDSTNPFALLYADSLTSQPITLAALTPADSIYLSFFYQPQGRGFAPETPDSLMLYFKRSAGVWTKVWAVAGTTLDSFRQVMIPVNDTGYFHADFQFRFVNKASINVNDDVWNLDYIRMGLNRGINDTAVGDITTTNQPTNLLNDYTSMPYRQFKANTAAELAGQHTFSGRNLYGNQRSVVYGYQAREEVSNTILFISGSANDNLPAYGRRQYSFASYTPNYTAPGNYARVVFENKYFISQPAGADPKENDTIIHRQVFDNYLAYDDGTAEKSYFLKQGATLPAKTAIEFHLNQPDTLRGVAIYFGRQVPLALSKFFDIAVYRNVTVGSYFDTTLYVQTLNFPGYVDTINHFWVYRFDTAVALPAGTFFIGTIQPAQSGSDSLYFGLDVNRLGGNHLYVNSTGQWQSSAVQGALMVRPLLGQAVIGTDVPSVVKPSEIAWSVYPVPAKGRLNIETSTSQPFSYQVLDMQGRVLVGGASRTGSSVDIEQLSPGIYFVRILAEGRWTASRKIIKL